MTIFINILSQWTHPKGVDANLPIVFNLLLDDVSVYSGSEVSHYICIYIYVYNTYHPYNDSNYKVYDSHIIL